MRKGLTATLMTVAVVLMAVQAMAEAPMIQDIPSPIVGSAEQVSGVTGFVWQDAINLNTSTYVTDDSTAPADILWTYAITGTAHYTLNGVPQINVGTENPGDPPAGKVVNTQVLNGELDLDANPKTITIRNTWLSPLTGTGNSYSGSGILSSEIQAVTLFASDGTTFSQTSVFFYSDAGGEDRLSQPDNGDRVVDDHYPFTGYQFNNPFPTLGTCTSSTLGGTAICLNVPAAGRNWGEWKVDYGKISLVKNSVYRIRATMVGSQTAIETTPFWDIVIDNINNAGTVGFNAYGADFMFLDNVGGANGLSTTPKTFEMWFTPAAVKTDRWNLDQDNGGVAGGDGSSLFSTDNQAFKDARFTFRVMDDNINGGITADNDLGSVCLRDLVIDRFDIGTMSTVADPNNYSVTTLTSSTHVWENSIGCTTSITGGAGHITPSSVTSLGKLVPGQTWADDPAVRVTNWPVPWPASPTLFMVTVSMNGGSNPIPIFWVGSDAASTELVAEAVTTNQCWRAGMPQPGASQDFVFFMYSNTQSVLATTQPALEYARLRPTVQFGGNTAWSGGIGSTGVVNITGMKMEKVRFY